MQRPSARACGDPTHTSPCAASRRASWRGPPKAAELSADADAPTHKVHDRPIAPARREHERADGEQADVVHDHGEEVGGQRQTLRARRDLDRLALGRHEPVQVDGVCGVSSVAPNWTHRRTGRGWVRQLGQGRARRRRWAAPRARRRQWGAQPSHPHRSLAVPQRRS